MTNKRTNRAAQKREKHFDRQQRKRAAVSKKIAKAKAGHDQWTGWERLDQRARQRRAGDE